MGGGAGRKTGAHAGAEDGFAAVVNQHDLADEIQDPHDGYLA
jgi:hypothetical protein